MPRFFFHLLDGDVIRDEEGMELPNTATAIAKAHHMARAIAAAEITEGKLCLHHRIEVTDVTGRPLLALPLRAAFEIEE